MDKLARHALLRVLNEPKTGGKPRHVLIKKRPPDSDGTDRTEEVWRYAGPTPLKRAILSSGGADVYPRKAHSGALVHA